ncbi:hypothetical protein ABID22_002869 [Pontibacter aydingkolensis]
MIESVFPLGGQPGARRLWQRRQYNINGIACG